MVNEVSRAGSVALAYSDELLDSLISGIADSRASTHISGGKPFMRLLKSGVWVYGPEDIPVQDGSDWAINTLSIQHGWSCWSSYPGNQKNTLLGEVLTPITTPKPGKPQPTEGFEWKEARAFDMKCMSGEDEGVEVQYKNASDGTIRGVDALLATLTTQLLKDRKLPKEERRSIPVVQLGSTSYNHSKYGQTFVPVFEVVRFITPSGDAAVEVEAKTPVEEAKPSLRPEAAARPGAAPRRQRPAVRT